MHFTSDDAHNVHGNITGLVNELPLHVQYYITIDPGWQVTAATIRVHDHSERELQFTRENGRWHDKHGTIHAIFDGCVYIDISLTPFTNALPINRLSLTVGEAQEITVLYFDLPAMDVKPVRQRYTRLADDRYRYESLTREFSVELEVDEDGLVKDYPGIWERIFAC
jgi:hypothetical protein